MTPHQIKRLKKFHAMGFSDRKIAPMFGVSREMVRRWRTALGLPPVNLTPRLIEAISEGYEAGLTDDQIASRYNCSLYSIRQYRRWQRARGNSAKAHPKATSREQVRRKRECRLIRIYSQDREMRCRVVDLQHDGASPERIEQLTGIPPNEQQRLSREYEATTQFPAFPRKTG